MLFRHWTSTGFAASVTVSVSGCICSNQSAPETSNQTVSVAYGVEPALQTAHPIRELFF